METTLIFIVIVATIFLAIKVRQGADGDTSPIKTPIKKEYVYIKKSCTMTPSELSFYKTLHEAINGCVIIPQAHLSMFLDHEIKGQSWKAAFATSPIEKRATILSIRSCPILICPYCDLRQANGTVK